MLAGKSPGAASAYPHNRRLGSRPSDRHHDDHSLRAIGGTWSFIKNPLDRAGLDSFHKDTMKMNADVFGKGYNILPIFKGRLNAKTLWTAEGIL